MRPHKDPLLRLVCGLHRRLDNIARNLHDPTHRQLAGLEEYCQLFIRSLRRHNTAICRQWNAAASRLQDDVHYYALQLHEQSRRLLTARTSRVAVPTIPLLLAELRQLHDEFEAVRIGPRHSMIGVQTEPIVLEDVELGPFSIELHLDRVTRHGQDSGCFACVALEPNPAQADPSVTHPHVRDQGLCAGDAAPAIAAALGQGRVCDAFLLVASVLRHYNPSSPYVALQHWQSTGCPDCERRVHPDEMGCCQHCDREVCEDCLGICDVCDQAFCRSCLRRDNRAGETCCIGCSDRCSGCNRVVSNNDLDADTGLCPQCLELNQKEEDDDEQDSDQEVGNVIEGEERQDVPAASP